MGIEQDINYLVTLKDLVAKAEERQFKKDNEIDPGLLDDFTLEQVRSVLERLEEESSQVENYADVLFEDPKEYQEYFDLIIQEVRANRYKTNLSELQQEIESQINLAENRSSLDEFVTDMNYAEEEVDFGYLQALRYLVDVARDPEKNIDMQTLDFLEDYQDKLIADIDMRSDVPAIQMQAILTEGDKEDLIVFIEAIAQNMNYQGGDALNQLYDDLDNNILEEMNNYSASVLGADLTEQRAIEEWMEAPEGTPLPSFSEEESVSPDYSGAEIDPEINDAFESLSRDSPVTDVMSSEESERDFTTADFNELEKALDDASWNSTESESSIRDESEKEVEREPKPKPETLQTQTTGTKEELEKELKNFTRLRDDAIQRIAKGMWHSKDKQRSVDAITAKIHDDAMKPRGEDSSFQALEGKKVLNGKKDNQRIYGKALDYQKCINETKNKLEEAKELDTSSTLRGSKR